MKKISLILRVGAVVAMLSLMSCERELTETIVGTWNTSDGGSISFNDDGTGMTSDSDFFEVDLGNGVISEFTYELRDLEEEEQIINILFEDEDGSFFGADFTLTEEGRNELTIGFSFAGISDNVTLTR